jgi:hypothetical protein
MECMTASQSSNIIIFLQCVNANGTGVSWVCEQFWWNSGMDMIVVIVIFIVLAGNCWVLINGTGSRLDLF